MLCRKCQKEIVEGSVYCNWCGVKQEVVRGTKSRGNGQGTVFKIGNSWVAEVTLGYYMSDGKLKRKSARKRGFKTKKEAVLYLTELRTKKETPKQITVSELWDKVSSNWTIGKSKQTAYKIAWNRVKDAVGWRQINDFTVDELQELVDEAAPSYYTRRDIKTLLSKMYQLAIRDDYTDKNRAEFIKLPQHIAQERAVLTDEEINVLWAEYQANKTPIAAHMLVMLYTGIRPGELMNIKVENVHLDEHYMTGGIKTEKGKRRKIIIPHKLEPVIKHLIETARRGRLAYYNKDSEFYDAWTDLRAALGIREEIKPYCCRHTYITNLTRLGVSPAMLQELVGHEDYDTTLNYTHLSVEDRLGAVDRL